MRACINVCMHVRMHVGVYGVCVTWWWPRAHVQSLATFRLPNRDINHFAEALCWGLGYLLTIFACQIETSTTLLREPLTTLLWGCLRLVGFLNSRSLLQIIVSFIGLFCKRDFIILMSLLVAATLNERNSLLCYEGFSGQCSELRCSSEVWAIQIRSFEYFTSAVDDCRARERLGSGVDDCSVREGVVQNNTTRSLKEHILWEVCACVLASLQSRALLMLMCLLCACVCL